MTMPDSIISTVLFCALGIYSILSIFMIFKSIKGPGTTNRVIAVNMLGTMVIGSIAILSVLLEQSWLLDVCLIYAMISFLAVVVVTKIVSGVILEKRNITGSTQAIDDNLMNQKGSEDSSKTREEDNDLI